MAGEIATAFVRIRPDLTGFKTEATAGIKSSLTATQTEIQDATRANVAASDATIKANQAVAGSFEEVGAAAVSGGAAEVGAQEKVAVAARTSSAAIVAGNEKAAAATDALKGSTLGLGKALGVAFGAALGIDFVKHIVGDAASVQKSTEVIQAQFGAASKSVLAFADSADVLGVKTHDALSTAAKLGIALQNVGVGKDQAAQMTVQLEKLAASLAQIRGVDPGPIFDKLNLAVLGNTRSLKQLGIAIDPVTEKYLAVKDGLIAANGPLTQSAKAITVVQIATQNLASYQAQAAKHSDDLANSQLRLSAEWDHSKEVLGAGLIPVFTKVVDFFSSILPGAVKVTQTVFGDLSDDISAVSSALASAIPASLVARIKDIGSAFSIGGAGGGFTAIVNNFKDLSPAAKIAVVAIGSVTAALVLMLAAAFPITATIIAIVGLGVAFDEAYKHSQRFRDIVSEIGDAFKNDFLPALQDVVARATPTIALLEKDVAHIVGTIVDDFRQFAAAAIYIWDHWGTQIKEIVNRDFNAALSVIQDIIKNITDAFDVFNDVLHGKWGNAWGSLKDIAHNDLDAVTTVLSTWGDDAVTLFTTIWAKIEVVFLEGVKKLIGYTDDLATFGIGPLLKHVGLGGLDPGKHAQDAIQSLIDGITSGQAASKAAKQVADAISTSTASALEAKTRDPALVQAATDLGASLSTNITTGATGKTGPNLAAEAAAQAAATAAAVAQAKLDKAKQSASDALLNAKNSLASAQATLNQLTINLSTAITKEVTDVQAAVEKAKENLFSIGQSLGQSLSTILDQPFVVAGQAIQDRTDKISLLFDRKSQVLQAQAAAINRQQSILGLGQDQLTLENLRRSVILPGGGELSTNTGKAIAELKAIAARSGGNKQAIDSFLLQFRGASLSVASDKVGLKQQALDDKKTVITNALQLRTEVLQVEQDTANRLKTVITRQIGDLVDAFDRHQISYARFKRGIDDIVAKGTPAFKQAGATLGKVFADQFHQEAIDILKQAGLIAHGPQRPGQTGQQSTLVNPLKTLLADQRAIDKIRNEILTKTQGIATKQLKEAQAQTKYLKALADDVAGHKSSPKSRNPGTASKTARETAGATS